MLEEAQGAQQGPSRGRGVHLDRTTLEADKSKADYPKRGAFTPATDTLAAAHLSA